MKSVRLLFRFAEGRKWSPRVEFPFDWKMPGKDEKRRYEARQRLTRGPAALTAEEIRKCLSVTKDHRDTALLLCSANFAMTPADLSVLKFTDIDSDGFLRTVREKNEEEVTGYAWQRTQDAIREYKQRSRIEPSTRYRQFIFIGERDNNLVATSISRRFKHIFKRAGIYRRGIGAKALRKAFANTALRSGMDRDVIKLCMGHVPRDILGIHYVTESPDNLVRQLCEFVENEIFVKTE